MHLNIYIYSYMSSLINDIPKEENCKLQEYANANYFKNLYDKIFDNTFSYLMVILSCKME